MNKNTAICLLIVAAGLLLASGSVQAQAPVGPPPAGVGAPAVTTPTGPGVVSPAVTGGLPTGMGQPPAAAKQELTKTGFNVPVWLLIGGGLVAAGLILRRYAVAAKEH